MIVRKTLWIAGMALVALALAAPAGASAYEWLHEGVPLEENADDTIKFNGRTLEIGVLGSTIDCEWSPTLTIKDNNESEITAAPIDTDSCKNGTGLLKGCEMKFDEPTNLPWPVTVNANNAFRITDMTPDAKFNCPALGKIGFELNFPEVTATPDDPEAISEVTLEAEGTVVIEGTESEFSATLESELEITEGAGTYGIG